MSQVTIIGTGHGGYAVAADLTLAGHDVTFYVSEKYASRVEVLFQEKTITLSGKGRQGEAKLYNVTSDPNVAFKNDIIMPVVPAYSLKSFAEEAAPHLRDNHKIFLVPGSTGGSLVVARKLHELGKLNGVKIAELHTLPYASRKKDNSSVEIVLMCKTLYFSAFPAKYNEEMHDIMKGFYPIVELQNDVLETSLNNGNPISHPAPIVLNAGAIEHSNGNHYHYRDGISPSVARVLEKMDAERKLIVESLGYPFIETRKRIVDMDYAPARDTLYESYRDSKTFSSLQGPDSLSNRYLTEDTPYSLMVFSKLAKSLDIQTPIMDSIIHLASALRDEDYFTTGISLEDLGLENKSIVEIKDLLQNGY